MRYQPVDQATRAIVLDAAKALMAGRISVDRAASCLLQLGENDDPRVQNALRIFVAFDSEMMELSAGTLMYMTKSLREDTARKIAELELSYQEDAVASVARIVSLFENRELAERTARILIEAWDPMNVGALPSGQDFYDAHVPGIHELLRAEATDVELADHLLHIEEETLRVPVDRPRALNVARLLIERAAEFRAQTSVNVD